MDGEIRHDYICDIDGDGKSDIVVFAGPIEVLRNLSLQGSPSFAPGVIISNGGNDNSLMSIGDINSDGKPDIAIVDGTGAVTILKNTSTIGNISFEKTTFYINSSPGYITIQDFDGDG